MTSGVHDVCIVESPKVKRIIRSNTHAGAVELRLQEAVPAVRRALGLRRGFTLANAGVISAWRLTTQTGLVEIVFDDDRCVETMSVDMLPYTKLYRTVVTDLASLGGSSVLDEEELTAIFLHNGEHTGVKLDVLIGKVTRLISWSRVIQTELRFYPHSRDVDGLFFVIPRRNASR